MPLRATSSPHTHDPQPLEAEVAQLSARLTSLARAIDPDDADDLAQETIARLLTAGSPLRYAPARTALIRIWIDRRRSARRRAARTLRWAVSRAFTVEDADHAAQDESRRRIDRALARLTPTQRAVVTLRLRESMPYASIAASIGVSEDAARAAMHAARARLRDLIGDQP